MNKRELIDVSRIQQEITDLLDEETAEDGTLETDLIEIDVDDLICWRDSIKRAFGEL